MPFSGTVHRVDLVTTDVSEERSPSIIRVTTIGWLGTTLVVSSNRRTLLTALLLVTALKISYSSNSFISFSLNMYISICLIKRYDLHFFESQLPLCELHFFQYHHLIKLLDHLNLFPLTSELK
jgi:hypothetical protein